MAYILKRVNFGLYWGASDDREILGAAFSREQAESWVAKRKRERDAKGPYEKDFYSFEYEEVPSIDY